MAWMLRAAPFFRQLAIQANGRVLIPRLSFPAM
jgi:hypothetical protein